MTAMSTLMLIAPSAAPERARYLARSRRASRTAIGARRAALASSARHAGATSTTPAHSAIRPTTRARYSVDLFPISAAADVACSLASPIRKNASTSSPAPAGPAQRRACRGAGGRPASAATIGTRAIALAGRTAARYAASTASAIDTKITSQGSWKAPMTW